MGDLIRLMIDAVAASAAVMALIVLFTETLTRWFEAGMAIKTRHERREYTGWRFVLAAVFVAGFILADFLFRNTVIVIQCQTRPAFELVTDYVERVTAEPGREPIWRLAIAIDYRRRIERIHATHFGRPNRAVGMLRRRLDDLAAAGEA